MTYRTCPECGANLDPEEKCDCRECNPIENKAKKDAAAQSQPQKKKILTHDQYIA